MSATDEDDEDEAPPGMPPGTPFYMTPTGHAALREELRRLWDEDRPKVVEVVSWAAGLGDRDDLRHPGQRVVDLLQARVERLQVEESCLDEGVGLHCGSP